MQDRLRTGLETKLHDGLQHISRGGRRHHKSGRIVACYMLITFYKHETTNQVVHCGKKQ